MASIRDIFKSIEDWARRILTPPKAVEDKPFWTPEMRAFLYAKGWVQVQSSNIKAVWFDIFRNEFHVEFLKDGRVYTVENFTTNDAVYFFNASSKGSAYWDLVRVRGPGNAHKTKKPYRKGM